MAKVAVNSVGIYAGPLYVEHTEDGPASVCDYFAAATTSDGRDFQHLVPFSHRGDVRLQRLVARIEAAKVIDTDHWFEMERTSLEDRLAQYALCEAEARLGLRSEDHLYDGVPVR
jgi:hypothetical protein